MEASVYIHVPFCTHKCAYCSFYSIAGSEGKEKYLSDIKKELRGLGRYGFSAPTVYIGGGTPSCMPLSFVPEVLAALAKEVELVPGVEITCEANPETFTPDHAAMWREAGVNRISFGVQSFDDAVLTAMGRGHRSEDATCAVETAYGAGIGNISIDLIYGYPGQSMESLVKSIRRALSLPISHISCYCLTVEEGTPLYGEIRSGRCHVDDDISADMEDRLIDMLTENGFARYEISNFARPGFESRHNSIYWQRKPYLGIGAGAHGCLGEGEKTFRYCHGTLAEYAREVTGEEPFPNRQYLTKRERMFEAVMLGTRMTVGLSLIRFETEFDRGLFEAYPCARRIIEQGLAQVRDGRFSLTKRGMEMQNTVLMAFMDP